MSASLASASVQPHTPTIHPICLNARHFLAISSPAAPSLHHSPHRPRTFFHFHPPLAPNTFANYFYALSLFSPSLFLSFFSLKCINSTIESQRCLSFISSVTYYVLRIFRYFPLLIVPPPFFRAVVGEFKRAGENGTSRRSFSRSKRREVETIRHVHPRAYFVHLRLMLRFRLTRLPVLTREAFGIGF